MQKHILAVAWLIGLLSLGACSTPTPQKSAADTKPPVWSVVAWQAQQASRTASVVPKSPASQSTGRSVLTTPVTVAKAPEPSLSKWEQPLQTEDEAGKNGIAVAANQCWAQVVIPARVTREQKELTVRDGGVRHEVLPPVLSQDMQSVVVKDGAQSFQVQPARFKAVTEEILVTEEVRKWVVEPAVFEERTEQVEVESSRIVMRECRSAGQAVGAPNQRKAAAAQCAVKLPARHRSVTRMVQVKAESVREEVTPAVYKTITRMVLDQDAVAVPVPIPEKRIQMPYQSVAKPSEAREFEVPAQTRKVAVKVHEGAPQLSWRQVLCQRDMSPALVTDLQKALQMAGLDTGKPDGKLGNRTWEALQNYQQREGLASGFLTYETLDRLAVPSPER